MIETIVFLPVLILLLAGATFWGNLYLSRLEARSEARSCTWRTAIRGCGEALPDCPGTSTTKTENTAMQERLNNSGAREAMTSDNSGTEAVSSAVHEQLDSFLSERVATEGRREVSRPGPLGGGIATASAIYSLPCNSRVEPADDLIASLFSGFTH